jgi:hypothetical protein
MLVPLGPQAISTCWQQAVQRAAAARRKSRALAHPRHTVLVQPDLVVSPRMYSMCAV